MAKIDLSKYGITGATEIVYNPSYELLFEEETKSTNEGYEVGKESELGAVDVMTGIYTGRSPKDKYIVVDENSKDTVWWTSDEYKNDNHPASEEAWAAVKKSSQHRFGFFQHAAPVHFHRQKPCKGISGFGRIHPFHLLVHGGCHLRQLCIGTVP